MNMLSLLMALAPVAMFVNPLYGQQAGSDPSELKTSQPSGVKYYVAKPKGWTPDKKWPILVAIDGAGHDFSGCCNRFVTARGDRPFIVVAPCVSSNGNDPAEFQAVISIVEEVQKDLGGRPKFFITGFSAGGHLTWQFVFNRPDLISGAAPAAANFRSRGIDAVSTAKERIDLPIRGFNGGKDNPVINSQWDDAEQLARKNGYQNITHTLSKEAGHTPFASDVVNYFATLLDR